MEKKLSFYSFPHSQQGNLPWNNYLLVPALFDVVEDPEEQRNLIDDAKFTKPATQLRKQLNNWWKP